MKAYVITFIAGLFAWWIIRQQDEPELWFNVLAVLGCVCVLILLYLGVFALCAYVM